MWAEAGPDKMWRQTSAAMAERHGGECVHLCVYLRTVCGCPRCVSPKDSALCLLLHLPVGERRVVRTLACVPTPRLQLCDMANVNRCCTGQEVAALWELLVPLTELGEVVTAQQETAGRTPPPGLNYSAQGPFWSATPTFFASVLNEPDLLFWLQLICGAWLRTLKKTGTSTGFSLDLNSPGLYKVWPWSSLGDLWKRLQIRWQQTAAPF